MWQTPRMEKPQTFDRANLRKARDDAGLSQSQLASKIGAHFTSVSDWERGKNVPTPRHIAGIAAATGRPVGFFFTSREDVAA